VYDRCSSDDAGAAKVAAKIRMNAARFMMVKAVSPWNDNIQCPNIHLADSEDQSSF
jgi:hypothetical protein